jgi:hypothetical protein
LEGDARVDGEGEGLAGVDVVLVVEFFGVVVDVAIADIEFGGDLFVGERCRRQEEEDLFAALGGGTVQVGADGALADLGEGRRFGDFVAEEQAGGEVGDEVVPGVADVCAGEEADAMAFVAGEERRGSGRSVSIQDRGVEVEVFGDVGDGEGVVEDFDLSIAGGAEEEPASEAELGTFDCA